MLNLGGIQQTQKNILKKMYEGGGIRPPGQIGLSYRFEISVATVAKVFQSWISLIDSRQSSLIVWPEREALLAKHTAQIPTGC